MYFTREYLQRQMNYISTVTLSRCRFRISSSRARFFVFKNSHNVLLLLPLCISSRTLSMFLIFPLWLLVFDLLCIGVSISWFLYKCVYQCMYLVYLISLLETEVVRSLQTGGCGYVFDCPCFKIHISQFVTLYVFFFMFSL